MDSKLIIQKINSDFKNAYRPYAYFTSNTLWNECINTVKDSNLMSHIIFCNDVLKIPPVKIFLMADNNIKTIQTDYEKKAIGAFWGFVFKFIYQYKSQKEISINNTKGVKTAAFFYDMKDNKENV